MILVLILILCVFLVGYLSVMLWKIYRDWPRIRGIWFRLNSFEKHLFNMGLMLSVAVPMIKNEMQGDGYFFQVISEIFPVVAGGMFVTGLIAFVREAHNYDEDEST